MKQSTADLPGSIRVPLSNHKEPQPPLAVETRETCAK